MVSPAVLTHLLETDGTRRHEWLNDRELLGLKLWLGLRYDRPAVPTTLVPLARAIAKAIQARDGEAALSEVREILVQFRTGEPTRFRLIAVILPTAIRAKVRSLLAEACLDVPIEIGTLDQIVVGAATEISLDVIENSFAIDVSQITWGRGQPRGAV
jgi:hypothetical protein